MFWQRKKSRNRLVSGFKKLLAFLTSPDFWTLKFIKNPRTLVFLTYAASYFLVAMLIGLFAVLAVFAYFSRALPNPSKLLEHDFELSTRLFDRNGKLLYEVYGNKNRTLVNLSDISPDVVHATLSAEDSEFYLHQGLRRW